MKISELFAQQIAELKAQSDATDKKIAKTLARAKRLIKDQAEREKKWADSN